LKRFNSCISPSCSIAGFAVTKPTEKWPAHRLWFSGFPNRIPKAVGIYIEHGKGHPTEFIPWEKVVRIEDEAIFITPSETGNPYPPFDDQKGWILLNEHLMGQTILDTDGRRTEVVNDVHLLFSKGRMILVHVDISFNGFLRKWGLERFATAKDQLISWRYVQPLSVEDHTKDVVTLSVAREQALGTAQRRPGRRARSAFRRRAAGDVFRTRPGQGRGSAGRCRTARQAAAHRFLSEEKARQVLAIMSVLQIADFFSNLPHAKATELMKLLPWTGPRASTPSCPTPTCRRRP
jgi:sporulation protein YlmC with PRC-barrel domain